MGTHENQSSGVSRRDLLKKGAVAGGIVWAAPIVLGGVAGAADAPVGSQNPCSTLYYVKYSTNPSTGVITGTCGTGVGNGDCTKDLVPGYSQNGGSDTESGCSTAYNPVDNTVVIDLYLNKDAQAGVEIQNVVGYTKAANDGCGVATVTPQPVTEAYPNGGYLVTFPRTVTGSGASHVEISFCA